MVKKKVALVTGAAGFVGANLVRSLASEEVETHVILKKTSNTWRIADLLSKISIHSVDLSDLIDLKRMVSRVKPNYIFHLAAHGSYPSQLDESEMVRTNLLGTYHLLKAAEEVPYESFVNIGTSSEYGFKNKPMRETDLLEPTTFYAATKAASTLFCQTWAKVLKRPVVTLRPFSVYGPWEEKGRFIPTIMINLLTNKEINLTKGLESRDFIYIDDFVEALLVGANLKEKLSGEVINIGTGRQTTVSKAVEILFQIAKSKVKVNKGVYKERPWDTTHWVADITKAKEIMRWSPKHKLEEGLHLSLSWFRENKNYYL